MAVLDWQGADLGVNQFYELPRLCVLVSGLLFWFPQVFVGFRMIVAGFRWNFSFSAFVVFLLLA